jgi:hypothetical protein
MAGYRARANTARKLKERSAAFTVDRRRITRERRPVEASEQQHDAGECRHTGSDFTIGRSRTRLPVSAKSAFARGGRDGRNTGLANAPRRPFAIDDIDVHFAGRVRDPHEAEVAKVGLLRGPARRTIRRRRWSRYSFVIGR